MAEAGKSNTNAASAEVQAEFDAVRRDIASLSEAVSRLLGETTDEARSRVRDQVSQTTTAAREAASAAGTRVTAFVEEKPTTSLLIAFGVGLLFGTFARRS